MASFDGRASTLSFSQTSGGGLSDGTTSIPIEQIVALFPSPTEKGEYTLLHTHSPEPTTTTTTPVLHKLPLVAPPEALISRYSLSKLPEHLDRAEVDISIIISAGSGTGKALKYWEDVLRPLLAEYGLDKGGYVVHTTTSADHIHELAAGISAAGRRQSVVLLSGDTLLFELLNSLVPTPGKRPIITLLPLGTGNALSASLSKSSAPLSTFLLGRPRPLPGFEATFSPGAQFVLPNSSGRKSIPPGAALRGSVVLSWGFHASLVADSDTAEFREKGIQRFQLAAQQNLVPEPHGYQGAVSVLPVGGEEVEWVVLAEGEKHFYTLATLVSNLEETFCISPESRPLGGGLYVVHFPVVSAQEVMRIMGMAYDAGKHVTDEKVRYENVKKIRIEVGEKEERWRRVCVDGAIVAVPEGGWVQAEVVPEGVVDLVWRE